MSPLQAATAAERLGATLDSARRDPVQEEKVPWGESSLAREAAVS